jgi:hypothetical protein
MSIIAKNDGGSYRVHPEGQFPAVCCDVVDLGMVRVEFGGKTKQQHKIRVVFQTDERDPDTRKRLETSQRFTLSMHEKANLRKFLESWRARAYTEDEAKAGVDVELMVCQHALLQVTHTTKNGKTYDNLTSVMRLPKGMPRLEIQDYVRVKDREPESDGPPPDDEYPMEDDGSDLPF